MAVRVPISQLPGRNQNVTGTWVTPRAAQYLSYLGGVCLCLGSDQAKVLKASER